MKRKFMAMVLVLALCLSLCVGASASSASNSGYTSGSPSGSKIMCYASLTVDANRGIAKTSIAGNASMSLATTVNFYYKNSNNQTSVSSSYGSGSATAGSSNAKGMYATSEHSASSTAYGSWSCSLTANI